MDIGSIVISACITIFALGLFVVSLSSYLKFKNSKLIFVSLVFLVFLVKGILMSAVLFIDIPLLMNLNYGLFDLGILALLFIATLKR